MKCKRYFIFILLSFITAHLFLLVSPPPLLQGQTTGDGLFIDANSPLYGTEDIKGRIITLKAIVESEDSLLEQIKSREQQFQTARTEDQLARIAKEIKMLNRQQEAFERNFKEIATGVDLDSLETEQKKGFNWQDEIHELLGPIIQEIRKATARPREIEKLRNEVAFYEKRIPIINKGIENIQRFISEVEEKRLREELNDLERNWMSTEQQLSNQLAVAQYQLNEKMQGRKSFLRSFQDILRVFFKSRGRNLIVAVLAFIFVWTLFHFFYLALLRITSRRKGIKGSFYSRLSNMIYRILVFVFATSAMLFVLYIAGDWVLLGLILVFLFGIAWAARQTIPRYWEQVRLLLNIGSVREDERLIYNALPWKVESLNFYTTLVNPDLKGGMLRIPIRELLGLNSRPYQPDEPWFPSREKDWVILADKTFGRVVTQTPEIVELVLLGGSHKTYTTPGFLLQNPNNLTPGFRISATIGIDYRHQSISTTDIPVKLENMLNEELKKEGFGEEMVNLHVEFKNSGSSSLNLEVLADFRGTIAKEYQVISRAIQRICVDACNRYGWVIPFTQLTIHTAGNAQAIPSM